MKIGFIFLLGFVVLALLIWSVFSITWSLLFAWALIVAAVAIFAWVVSLAVKEIRRGGH